MKFLKVSLIFITFILTLSAQSQDFNYEKAWQHTQKLSDKGLFAQALKSADSILQQAENDHESLQKVKSLIYKSNYRGNYQESATLATLEEIKKEITKSEGVEKAMLLVALSDTYFRYYHNNQWTIRERKSVSGPASERITEWSQENFYEEIASLLLEALSFEKELKQAGAENWKEVFNAKENSFNYQPFLFDFVAWKAIDFYQSREFYNQANDDLVLLNDPLFFQDYSGFIKAEIGSLMDVSDKEKSILLYQKLANFHLGRKNATPLLYEESKRLYFLSTNGIIDNKKELILNTLNLLFNNYQGQAGSEIIAKKLIKTHLSNYFRNESSIKKADDICIIMINAGIEKDYFTGISKSIHQQELSFSLEGIILPHQLSLAKITFKNLDHAWYKIVKVDKEEKINRNRNEKIDFKKFVQLPLAADFNIALANHKYLSEKTALFQVPELDFGRYAIIASSSPEFNAETDQMTIGFFWVSKLQLIAKDYDNEFLLIDRETGKPIEGAEIKVYSIRWEYSTRKNIKTLFQTLKSNKDGSFSVETEKTSGRRRRGSTYFEISKGVDEWTTKVHIYDSSPTIKTNEKHYFFTDRAIYRPGQTVYFKGIITEQTGNNIKPISQKMTEVKLYSTQGKVIQSLKLISNEFGSISGSFVCPLSGLNGSMRISDDKGSTSFKMEEYKRPKFEVLIDMPKEEFNLNEDITINGSASYYAGISLQNAQIKYTVIRSAYWSFRWTHWPIQTKTPIAAGETKTNEKGEFTIVFNAIAPQKPEEIYWYNYSIIAEVTDQTGETHTQTLDIKLGSHSLFIEANLPKVLDRTNATDVLVKAKTPNGKKVESILNFKLEKLESPEHIVLKRKWRSDTILLSKEDLKQNFKTFSTIDKISEFKVEAIVLEKTLNTKVDSIIPKSIFQSLSPSAYKMTLTTKDKNGKEVKKTAFVSILSSQNNKLPYAKDKLFLVEKTKVLVGDSIRFNFGTSYKKQIYYYQLCHGTEIIESGWRKLRKELEQTIIPVKEKYRGGVSAQIFFMNNNRFHSFTVHINVPYDNKKLDVKLISMRNPMQPGQKEKWALQIKNNKGDALAAEILAGMYDASLDVFAKNNWNLDLYKYSRTYYHWNNLTSNFSSYNNNIAQSSYHSYSQEFSPLEFIWESRHMQRNGLYMAKGAGAMPMMEAEAVADRIADNTVMAATVGGISNVEVADKGKHNPIVKSVKAPLSPRKNLNETAFFFPQLLTDKDGNVQLSFTSPEALSKWKLMVLATTKNMEIGTLSQEFITQKELMVLPNLPRFLRGGDRISLSSKVINLLDNEQKITTKLEILDAKTMKPIHILAENEMAEQSFTMEAKGQTSVQWFIDVPEKVGAVIIRVLAKGKDHSDGEEHMLPVLSQLQFLTDTYPFSLSEEQELTTDDLGFEIKDYQENDELILEITTNPLWYVVQALPNYSAPQSPSAIRWFNYYFINSMASSIVENNPQIETVFKQWQMESPEELESELAQNPKLKQILLEETPWVRDAESQTKRKQEIARLFDKNNLDYNLDLAINKLRDLQKVNGGFAWYDGMRTSVYMTGLIVEGMGKLKNENIVDFKKYSTVKSMTKQAVSYLDTELLRMYNEEINQVKKYRRSHSAYQILRARAYFLNEFKTSNKTQTAFDYYLDKWNREWTSISLNQQADLAKVFLLSKNKGQAGVILSSIKDKSLKDVFGGIYWRDLMKYSAPENQAAMIELFELAGEEKGFVKGLKLWLLQQKRSNDWGSGMATAKACYAMLSGSSSLNNPTEVFLSLDGKTIKVDGNAGTGYYKVSWKGKDIAKNLEGLKISKKGDALVFGALYEQHFEKISEIERHDGGVELEKKVFVAKTKDGKNELFELSESSTIQLGDRILVRIILNNKQAMDFVHLRDYLPAGFENQKPLSGYRWQGNIGFYQSPTDIATDYFIHHLPKGEFVIEYELNASSAGLLNLGPAVIQSFYAPEFGGHSDGGKVFVKDE